MAEFKTLFEEVLRQRPNVSREELLKRIEEKKRRVGSGYLTDQGALFLVASDLSVSLDRAASLDLTVKDIYIGANEITILGRVSAIYPSRRYLKRDGSEGIFRRLILFDDSSSVKVLLWDEKALLAEELSIRHDALVRVVKGYVKAGLDGRPVLYVGTRGTLELPPEENLGRRLPFLQDMVKDVNEVKSSELHVAVKGFLSAPPRLIQFVRKDGAEGRALQLRVRSVSTSKDVRVVIWDDSLQNAPDAPMNSLVKLVNLRAKVLPHGEVELHGDEGTIFDILPDVEGHPALETPSGQGTTVFRLLTVGQVQSELSGGEALSCMVVDAQGKFFTLIVRGKALQSLLQGGIGRVFECSSRAVRSSLLVCDETSSVRFKDDDQSLPTPESLKRKVSDLKETGPPVWLEALALSRTSVQEITTREGLVVKKAEVLVGDETGEVKVVAWRALAGVLDGITPGQRLRLSGVIPKPGRDGQSNLQLLSSSTVERLN